MSVMLLQGAENRGFEKRLKHGLNFSEKSVKPCYSRVCEERPGTGAVCHLSDRLLRVNVSYGPSVGVNNGE